jgi:alkylation response protein AidB-like acyl-CoA dehydrogenase
VTDVVARARRIAEELLAPAAAGVDAAGRVPAGHLDALAAAGLYGLPGPAGAGGLDADPATVAAVVEELAAGDLATTFVWLQHLGVVARVAAGPAPLREELLAALCAGRVRAGVALQAATRPGPAAVQVRREGADFVLDGEVPWVTGWDLIDTVHVAARDPDDVIHYLLVDAVAGPSLAVEPLDLLAAQASRTVTLRFTGHRVPADRLTGTQPHAEWLAADAAGSAMNGYLALGVANRCLRLLGPSRLDGALDRCRADLAAAGAATTPAARAAASRLALRAAAALAVHTGARAVLAGEHAQRLTREATFLLVFGSRPAIRDRLLEALTTESRS